MNTKRKTLRQRAAYAATHQKLTGFERQWFMHGFCKGVTSSQRQRARFK